MPEWVQAGYFEYAKRLPREFALQLHELPLANRSKSTSIEKVKLQEESSILAAIRQEDFVIALDVGGRSIDTPALAKKLQDWQMSGKNISIVIGGPDGLSDTCLERADARWSLSALTLPHPLVRILLVEQLYRAWTILQNHPYHK